MQNEDGTYAHLLVVWAVTELEKVFKVLRPELDPAIIGKRVGIQHSLGEGAAFSGDVVLGLRLKVGRRVRMVRGSTRWGFVLKTKKGEMW